MLALQLLGPVELCYDGRALPLTVRKTAALLALLALGGPSPRARVAATLWPDLDESTSRRNLRRELARLREVGAGAAVQADGDRLALAPEVDVDVHRFRAALRAGQPDQALALWRGAPADDLRMDELAAFSTWLDAERERLVAARRDALDHCAASAESAGRLDIALQLLDQLLADDPLQERHHRAAMRVLASAGRREDALARYQRCCALLQAELGLQPSAETELLATRLRGPAASVRTATPATALSGAPAERSDAAATMILQLPDRMPFVGRVDDLAWLDEAWRTGQVLHIEGEGGVGKSRLATDFAASRGPYALARCRPGDAELPLSSMARVLRVLAGPAPAVGELAPWVLTELVRLLPELGPPPPPLRTDAERHRLGRACALAWQAWAAGNFDAVVIDDWHFADVASQSLLLQMDVSPAMPVRQVLVFRPGLTAATTALLQRQRDAGALHRVLRPWTQDEVLALLHRLSGVPGSAGLAGQLMQATGGRPFYICETLRHLGDAGLLRADAQGGWRTTLQAPADATGPLTVSEGLHDAVLARVRRLPDPALRVLEAAAMAQEPFSARLLAPACALSEVETALALEAALQARLLREVDASGFAFEHDLVQQALDTHLGSARRRSVHRRLALGAAAANAPAAQVAGHHEAGGEHLRAVAWRRRAGDEAKRLLALDEAIVQWELGIADGATGDPALELGCAIVRAHALRSRDAQALQRGAWLLDQVQHGAGSPQGRTLALVCVAGQHARRGRTAEALALLDRLPPLDDPGLRAQALMVRAEVQRAAGRLDDARLLAREALAQPKLAAELHADILDALLLIEFAGGRFDQALPCADAALALSRAAGDDAGAARALGRRAAILMEMGALRDAEQELNAAAALCARIGMLGQQRSALFNLCALFSAQSRPADVLRVAREAWAVEPPMQLEPLRTQLRLAFVEAHAALGELGSAWRWALGAIDDARALQQAPGLLAVAQTAAEVLAVLGESARLAPLLEALTPDLLAQRHHVAAELWIVHTECALMDGDLPRARHCWAESARWQAQQPGRISTRSAIVGAALQLAGGDAAAALATLPDDHAPGMNGELRLRALAVRVQAEAAAGRADESSQRAQAALDDASAHALAALQLHRALLRAQAQRGPEDGLQSVQGWQRRVARLADSLAAEPGLLAQLLARWPYPGSA